MYDLVAAVLELVKKFRQRLGGGALEKAQSRLFSEFGHALTALPRFLEGGAARLLFATNAGMFNSPVGLYVEQGRELVRATRRFVSDSDRLERLEQRNGGMPP